MTIARDEDGRYGAFRTSIAVLGDANAGKSTLLNALVFGDRALLPSAGIGSVTGVATRLGFATTPSLTLRYHALARVLELCYALEHLDAMKGGNGVPEGDYASIPAGVRRRLREDVTADLSRDLGARTIPASRLRHIEAQARTLVFGDPVRAAPLEMARAGLRRLLGLSVSGRTKSVLEPRVAFLVHQLLRSGRTEVQFAFDGEDPYANELLRLHVSGALSVLTADVELKWPSPLLENGLELVDLPGLGVASDAHQQVTKAWLRDALDGVLLVCTRAGITSSVADALEASGILASLVRRWTAEAPTILVAVSKLDDEASQLRRSSGVGTRREHFQALAYRIPGVIRTQVAEFLQKALPLEDPSRIVALSTATPVIAVSAPSYLMLGTGDEDVPPFLGDSAQTNIPNLAGLLAGIAHARQEKPSIVRGSVHQRHGYRSEV